jgi:hypothetical protein
MNLNREDYAALGDAPFALNATNLQLLHSDAEIDSDGRLHVKGGVIGFIAYGPYTHLPAGRYRVLVNVAATSEADEPFARFEVFNGLNVVASAELKGTVELEFELLSSADALEFRLYAYGAAFLFSNIVLWPIEAPTGPELHTPSSREIERGRLLEYAWAALHRNPAGSAMEVLSAQIARISLDELLIWSRARPLGVIDASTEQGLQQSAKACRSFGLSIEGLRRCRFDRFEDESRLAEVSGEPVLAELLASFAGAREPGLPGSLRDLTATDGVCQFTAAELGYLTCPCPITGVLLKSAHGLPVTVEGAKQTFIFYKFDGASPFYLVVAGFGGRKTFLYLPMIELAIYIGNRRYNWTEAPDQVSLFRALALLNLSNVHDYFARPTQKAVLIDSVDNMGHSFWNDLSGILRFSEFGLLDGVENVLAHRFRFLDATALPALANRKYWNATTAADLFETSLKQGLFPFRPTALRVESRWAQTIIETAHAGIDADERAKIAEAQELDRLIFFNLRVHNKSWLDQAKGAIAIAAEGVARGLQVGLFLDGMPDCVAVANKILAGLPNGAVGFVGCNKSVAATLAWACACDGYVATIGSGLTTLTWIAALPGVAHSESSHLGQEEFWHDVRPDAPAPVMVKRRWVTDVGEGPYGNYKIDPQRVAKLFWTVLDKADVSRRVLATGYETAIAGAS